VAVVAVDRLRGVGEGREMRLEQAWSNPGPPSRKTSVGFCRIVGASATSPTPSASK
jgi:hypothetical protein